jgi:hypothetical protein
LADGQELTMAPTYKGNVPSNVSKEAKYSVVHGPGGMEIRLIYRLSAGDKALVTTRAHPKLVKMVNAVKEAVGQAGGAFYINEYGFVLVLAQGECFYAGKYQELLEFEFEGRLISAKAPDGLVPGTNWVGPRVGIRYKLTAEKRDIGYKVESRPSVFNERRLSEDVGAAAAQRLASRLGQHKPEGGRIYINEAREFFAPTQAVDEISYVYLGSLGDDLWFQAPVI